MLFRVFFICLKLTNRALVLVPCHFVEGTFEATFHEMGSRPSPVPLRGIEQHSHKMLKIHEVSSRASPVPFRGAQLTPGWVPAGSWLSSGCLLAAPGYSRLLTLY